MLCSPSPAAPQASAAPQQHLPPGTSLTEVAALLLHCLPPQQPQQQAPAAQPQPRRSFQPWKGPAAPGSSAALQAPPPAAQSLDLPAELLQLLGFLYKQPRLSATPSVDLPTPQAAALNPAFAPAEHPAPAPSGGAEAQLLSLLQRLQQH